MGWSDLAGIGVAFVAAIVVLGLTALSWAGDDLERDEERAGGLHTMALRVPTRLVLGVVALGILAWSASSGERVFGTHAMFYAALALVWLVMLVSADIVPIRALVSRLADRLLYGESYEFETTLHRFSRHLSRLRSTDEIVTFLLDELADVLNLTGIAYISLPEGFDVRLLHLIEADDLRTRRQFDTNLGKRQILEGLGALDLHSRWPRVGNPLLLYPWPGCAALVLVGPGDASEAVGLLVIGAKYGGHRLRHMDRILLRTVAHQAATAFSNAQLMDGLRISLRQVESFSSQLVATRAELQLLLRRVVAAEENQRAALARDLHDDALQQVLYVIRHAQHCGRLAETLLHRGDLDASGAPPSLTLERLREETLAVADMTVAVERKLRALCLGLYPEALPSLGLTAALEDLAQQMRSDLGIAITFTCDANAANAADDLPHEAAVHVYRVVQESLTNAGKHGGAAAHVQMTLHQRHDSLGRPSTALIVVEISDDGKGISGPIDFGQLLRGGHMGLAGMRERADQIGATLDIGPAAEGGLRVTLSVPVDAPGMVDVEREPSGTMPYRQRGSVSTLT